MIRIAIIEDIREVALGVRDLINEDENLTCTQVYHTAEEALAFLPQQPPDIVISDIGLPGEDGISAIVKLRELCPQVQFCMFTVFEDNEKIFRSIKAGAKGYILKNSDPETIISAVKDLYSGGSPMNPEIARRVIDAFAEARVKPQRNTALPLTDRELEILDHLSKGRLYKEIAEHLGITTGTVKQHIHKVYDKLQVNNRTEAINLYLDRN